jgi:hypothetical protein
MTPNKSQRQGTLPMNGPDEEPKADGDEQPTTKEEVIAHLDEVIAELDRYPPDLPLG